jgi:hypothetical protein
MQVPMPVPVTTWVQVADHLIDALPRIVLALGTVATAWQAWRNGKKASAAFDAAAVAAEKADAAHKVTTEVKQQAVEIRDQTDGQLSKLLEKNEELHRALTTVLSAISARSGEPFGVRAEDVQGVLDLPKNGTPSATNRRQSDRRTPPEDAPK